MIPDESVPTEPVTTEPIPEPIPVHNKSDLVKYVCVATERKLYLPYLQQLLPELVILGLNTPWRGFITKYKLLIKYLSENDIQDTDLICFIDAYDVLPTKNIHTLAAKYRAFIKKRPKAKIIVGYDKSDNIFREYLCSVIFGTVDDVRLNSGQFIGTAKDIREMIEYILEYTIDFKTDQIELTKYANQFKEDIHIDENQEFFYVKSRPLLQVLLPTYNDALMIKTPVFIHANGNGFLESFLKKEHNISVSWKEYYQNLLDNIKGLMRKIAIYDIIYVKKYINKYLTQLNECLLKQIKYK